MATVSETQELAWKVEELECKIEGHQRKHEEAKVRLADEAKQLRQRLKAALQSCAIKAQTVPTASDDIFIRRVDWRLEKYNEQIKIMPKGDAIWSPDFAIMDTPGLKLEFFPNGKDTTKNSGFCALFLWCPAGVSVKYRLRVGSHWAEPEQDEYKKKMGHGHSNFCLLEPQVDRATDSLVVGVEILSISYVEDLGYGVRLFNDAPEGTVMNAMAVMQNREMNKVEWKIKDIRKRLQEMPRGNAMYSRLFTIAGVRDMQIEFYPNGIAQVSGTKPLRDGWCAFYVRANDHGTLNLTMKVAETVKGPVGTSFERNQARGLPEFCDLAEELKNKPEIQDLICSVTVENPRLMRQDGVIAI